MKRSKPAYELLLEDRAPSPGFKPFYTDAKLLIDGRIVCRTTLDPGTTHDHPDAVRFVNQFFHRPDKMAKPRKPRLVPMMREITDVQPVRKRYPRKSRRRDS
jgi:hypothetical protein